MQTEPVKVSQEITNEPSWKLKVVHLLRIIGIFATFIGAADFINLISFLPLDGAKWLVVSGPTLATSAKSLVVLLGDLIDNGKKDGSFTLPLWTFLAIGLCGAGMALPSCRNLTFSVESPYGSATSSKSGDVIIALPHFKIPTYSNK